MISRYVYPDGTCLIEIHCGCCGQYFFARPGGSCFCAPCLEGTHYNCRVREIMKGVEPR